MTTPEHPLSRSETRERLLGLRGVLFDLDGVLTPTVDIHKRAWERLFTGFLTARGDTQPYTDGDYFAYVDGKPRYDGVRALLASRGITLPDGDPSDSPDLETVCGLGNRKNDAFNATLAEQGVAPYPGSIEFLDFVVAAGLEVAVVTSSRNGEMILAAAGIRDRFDVVVDGLVAAAARLPGKPAPDTYAHAATLLGLTPAQCVVVEDAQSGVQAGRAGDFGLVLGVDRGVGAQVLLEDGADSVVQDLAELVAGHESSTTASNLEPRA
jgi:beta-phosphoglucomutase family hydrolase